MNRGVEIADEVADLPRSLVLRQVANGVAVRMAVLFLLLGQPWVATAPGAVAGLGQVRRRPMAERRTAVTVTSAPSSASSSRSGGAPSSTRRGSAGPTWS